jgi:hypothetical protein
MSTVTFRNSVLFVLLHFCTFIGAEASNFVALRGSVEHQCRQCGGLPGAVLLTLLFSLGIYIGTHD